MTENAKPKRYKLKEVCIRLERGRSLYSEQPLSNPASALDVMRREMSQYDREVLCVVNMNARLQPINFNVVSVGDINTSVTKITQQVSFVQNANNRFLLMRIVLFIRRENSRRNQFKSVGRHSVPFCCNKGNQFQHNELSPDSTRNAHDDISTRQRSRS